DAELTARYKKAGLVICGRTNAPEFGILPTTEPRLFGPCRNPWSLDRSTGGSSGGSAAAVAAGLVPMAHGNDGGGSIRIPASCCGLFGLKPTRARNPMGPDWGDSISGFVCEHALTRSVRDSAALLDATAGPDLGDPYWAPPPARPFLQEVGADPGRLRIAFTTRAATGADIHPECVRAVQDAAQLCQDLGHHVEESDMDLPGDLISENFMIVWTSGCAQTLSLIAKAFGGEPDPNMVEPLTWALYQEAKSYTGADYLNALAFLQQTARAVARYFTDYDVWITPVVSEPPPLLGAFDSTPENPRLGIERAAEYVPFTPICNATGQPAMSVPLHRTADGLPVGVHFIGRFGDEATLFRLAAQLEEARPWADRRPPVSAEVR
ncbi:MAG: amidase, partial [Proteobacteria bacterium]|nr:amidase [Pseudomonadota bacterium]